MPLGGEKRNLRDEHVSGAVLHPCSAELVAASWQAGGRMGNRMRDALRRDARIHQALVQGLESHSLSRTTSSATWRFEMHKYGF